MEGDDWLESILNVFENSYSPSPRMISWYGIDWKEKISTGRRRSRQKGEKIVWNYSSVLMSNADFPSFPLFL